MAGELWKIYVRLEVILRLKSWNETQMWGYLLLVAHAVFSHTEHALFPKEPAAENWNVHWVSEIMVRAVCHRYLKSFSFLAAHHCQDYDLSLEVLRSHTFGIIALHPNVTPGSAISALVALWVVTLFPCLKWMVDGNKLKWDFQR